MNNFLKNILYKAATRFGYLFIRPFQKTKPCIFVNSLLTINIYFPDSFEETITETKFTITNNKIEAALESSAVNELTTPLYH